MAGMDKITSENAARPRDRTADASPAHPPQMWGEGAELLTHIVDSLPVGLIYFEHGGAGFAANRFARKVLDLPSADLGRDAAARRLAVLGVAPESMETDGRRPERAYEISIGRRRYATTAFSVEGVWGRGTVLRIEDVTGAGAVEARLSEDLRAPLAPQADGGAGHDFNNLLSRVISLAEEIQDQSDLQVIHGHAETLIVTAERGAEIVRRHMAGAGPPDA